MVQQNLLAVIRATLCDRIDADAIRQQRLATADVSMPSRLLAASLWLADQGWDEQPSPGELFFAWGPAACRRYLERLSPAQRAQELEAGRRVIFDGRGGRPPLIDDAALESLGVASVAA